MATDSRLQWLHDLVRDKRKSDNLSMMIPYLDKQLEMYRIKLEEGPLEEHQQTYYDSIKLKQEDNKRNNEIYQDRYNMKMEKFIKDGILTEEVVKDLVGRSRLIHRIQTEIQELMGEKAELDEEQKEKMDHIQENYERVYGFRPSTSPKDVTDQAKECVVML